MTSNDATRPQQLVPMLHVVDVQASARFYEALGFGIQRRWAPEGASEPTWISLPSKGAHLMLAKASAAVVPDQQAALFYLYVGDVPAAHQMADVAGLAPGRTEHQPHSPAGEFRVSDPSGYALIVRAALGWDRSAS